MNVSISIELKQLRFRAYHGLYPEEKKTGNEFEVNIIALYQPLAGTITGVSDTVDYGRLYELVKKEMEDPRQLLETLAMEMAENIHATFPRIKMLEIAITKMHVPMAKFTGTATVKYVKNY